MKPELIIIETNEGVNELIQYLEDKDLVALDTETTGVIKGSEVIGYSVCAEESRAYYVITAAWNVGTKKLDYKETKTTASLVMQALKDKRLIGHNFIFDAMMIENNYRVKLMKSLHTDTMVAAHLLDENQWIGLKPLAAKYFGEDSRNEQREMIASIKANGGSVTKDFYELYKADSRLIARYGAMDALLTYKLFYQLVPELFEQGLDEFFYNDECMPLLKGPTYDMNSTGLQVDLQRLATLKKTLEAECLEAKDFIYQEIKNHVKERYPGVNKKTTFNIGSPQQLSWLLFGKLELEFGKLSKVGKEVCKRMDLKIPYVLGAKRSFIAECLNREGEIYQPEVIINGKKKKAKKIKAPWGYIACDKDTLKKLAPKYKWIERLLEYKRKTKIISTYIKGIESRTQYGIIYPSFLQTGTTSGRYSSRKPNFQNLPRDDKRVKECITSRSGKVFVGADQSQLEPRLFAYISKDKRLLEAFRSADDFYSVIGMEVHGKTDCIPRKDGAANAFGVKYKNLRNDIKEFALASTYGATAHRLAPKLGKSIDATQQDLDNYFESFPDVAKMMLDAHEEAKTGQSLSIFGRPRRIPEAKRITKIYGKVPHSGLPYEVRKLLNLAVNHKMQSAGASIMNRAAIRFYANAEEANIECRIALQVHDSLIVECSESDAENVALLLQDAMENTIQLEGVRFEAVPKIGKNLAVV